MASSLILKMVSLSNATIFGGSAVYLLNSFILSVKRVTDTSPPFHVLWGPTDKMCPYVVSRSLDYTVDVRQKSRWSPRAKEPSMLDMEGDLEVICPIPHSDVGTKAEKCS